MLTTDTGRQTADARADLFHAGGLFPLWQNITPPEIVGNETAALEVFQGIRFIAGKYSGSPSVATLLETGLSEYSPFLASEPAG